MQRLLVAAVFMLGLAPGATLGLTGCSSDGTVCRGDHCVCALAAACSHDCTPGGESCEVQCAAGEPCDVGCAAGELCHVECSSAAGCDVDCGSSPECHVTCPAAGCTVHNCVGAACVVSCGLGLPASRTGATATCG
jgi:hypothetical protein